MNAVRFTPLLLAATLLSGACASTPPSKAGGDVFAFVHASVIPMDQERVLRDHTVVVSNGTIAAIGPTSEVNVPSGAHRIDAQGRYLLPALCDMHVHQVTAVWNMMLPPEARVANDKLPYENFLFPYIANGVTTVQDLSATTEDIELRNRIRNGELLGPRMILARMIDGPDKAWPPPLSTWVASPEEARQAVRRAKEEGVDKIKAYSFLSRESYHALVATANEVGMEVIGHVPMALSVGEVIDAGQTLIAHSEELAKHANGDYSKERIDDFAGRLAQGGVWMVPTLVTTHSLLELFDHPDELLGRPEAVYYRDPLQSDVWTFVTDKLYAPSPPKSRQRLRDDFYEFQRPLTRAIHEKGGKLLAGSDTLLPGLVPGFALHRELQELVDVGLTPYEALRTATTNPFRVPRRERPRRHDRRGQAVRPAARRRKPARKHLGGVQSGGRAGPRALDRRRRNPEDDAEHRRFRCESRRAVTSNILPRMTAQIADSLSDERTKPRSGGATSSHRRRSKEDPA